MNGEIESLRSGSPVERVMTRYEKTAASRKERGEANRKSMDEETRKYFDFLIETIPKKLQYHLSHIVTRRLRILVVDGYGCPRCRTVLFCFEGSPNKYFGSISGYCSDNGQKNGALVITNKGKYKTQHSPLPKNQE